jgi:hypothetical protein
MNFDAVASCAPAPCAASQTAFASLDATLTSFVLTY